MARPLPRHIDADTSASDSRGHARPSKNSPLFRWRPPLYPFCKHERVKATKGRHILANLAPGAKAPPFRLPRDGGQSISLADFKGKKLVLFFYPKADTPGCTTEARAFSALNQAFAQVDTAVIGVSADSIRAQDRFKKKHDLATPLASDESHHVLEAYGVWGQKSMYGRTYLGITRTTFLIGADGRIARIWSKVKVPGHAEEVLTAAKAL
jgi:thioredoxin-dependent peroxiredoxin